jgi:hypothetical protein
MNTWRINTILLKDQRLIKEIREKFKIHKIKLKHKLLKLLGHYKAVLRGKFIAMNIYTKHSER